MNTSVPLTSNSAPTWDYKCMLSTTISVIDPGGNMRMCWNDMDDAQRMIGNVFTDGFKDAWESDRHLNICRSMNPEFVCNAPHGCHCRIVGYQQEVEPTTNNIRTLDISKRYADQFLWVHCKRCIGSRTYGVKLRNDERPPGAENWPQIMFLSARLREEPSTSVVKISRGGIELSI